MRWRRYGLGMVCIVLFAAFCRLFPGLSGVLQRNISVPMMSALARFSGSFRFPVTGALVLVVVAAALFDARRCVICLLILATAFVLIWTPCVQEFEIKPASQADVHSLCMELVDELNEGGRHVLPVDAVFRQVKEAMDAPALPKAVGRSGMMRRLGLAGIYVPVTGEALVDVTRSLASLPFVAAHELAHMHGIGSEAQANVEAYMACVEYGGAPGYSARLWALRYASERIEDASALYSRLDCEILADLWSIPESADGEYSCLVDWLCTIMNTKY